MTDEPNACDLAIVTKRRNRVMKPTLALIALLATAPAIANPCDDAITRERAALQASIDATLYSVTPTITSQSLTGAPTDETLDAELAAASTEVDAACKGRGPSQ